MTSFSIAILLISSLFCMGCTALVVIFKRSTSNKDKLLAEMRTALEALQKDNTLKEENPGSGQAELIFDDNLRAAELTTRLQQSRLSVQQRGYSSATPERYHYIQAMVTKGMSVQEIASTLFMSLAETTQLVTLIKMAQPHPGFSEENNLAQELTASDDRQSATVAQHHRPVNRQQAPASSMSGGINKSIKLARWLKKYALTPCLRKQSGREPPPHPLPQSETRYCHPLPGYT